MKKYVMLPCIVATGLLCGVNYHGVFIAFATLLQRFRDSVAEMEPGQVFWPVTRPNPIRSLSVVKQILNSGLIAVSVTWQETQTV